MCCFAESNHQHAGVIRQTIQVLAYAQHSAVAIDVVLERLINAAFCKRMEKDLARLRSDRSRHIAMSKVRLRRRRRGHPAIIEAREAALPLRPNGQLASRATT